jgi:polyhydroxyalkanoate synthase
MLDKPKPTLAPRPPLDIRPAPSPARVTAPAIVDRMLHAWQSRFTAGRSPSTLGLACEAAEPARQLVNAES